MPGRPSREATLALAYLQRTGCTPAVAAAKYGLAATTVRRAMVRAGMTLRPPGRPARESDPTPAQGQAPQER